MTPEEVEELIKPVSIEEIKSTMFAIKEDKAPGPDGFSSHFFKAAWRIIGEDVVAAVRHFFSSSFILPCFNATVVALIPKNQSPRSIKEYRPISCCSVIYKCITKIMANRIKQFMPTLVGNNQCAFIPGCSISDNILMAQELVRDYNRSSLSSRCAIKVDL